MTPSRRSFVSCCGSGLVRRRELWAPTPLGWAILFLLGLLLAAAAVWRIYPFLAVNQPLAHGPVVVEGWAGTHAFQAAIAEYRRHPVPPILVSGGPIEDDSPLAEQFATFADLGAWQLRRLGMQPELIQMVPSERVKKDRTFGEGQAVREWFLRRGALTEGITVVSSGPHSRRTRLLWEHAFGKETRIGILAAPEPSYDPARWWSSSAGFRTVTDEAIAYAYARLIFWKRAE